MNLTMIPPKRIFAGKRFRHLSYIFRHADLVHEDGSLSVNELLDHAETARKIRAMYRDGYIKHSIRSMLPQSRLLSVAKIMPFVFLCHWHMSFAMPINLEQ